MADNVAITPGRGATVAADDIGGVLHQRVKVEFGADGSASDVSTANPLPVGLKASTPVALAATGRVVSGATTYRGISVQETTGTTRATVVLHDSLDATGTILDTISLNAGESRDEEYAGRAASAGIYAVVTGAIQGSVFRS